MRVLIWFRNDLRVQDHVPLYTAANEELEVLPVYVVDARWHDQTHRNGFEQMGAFRRQFYAEALLELSEKLAALGAPIYIMSGAPETTLPALAKKVGAAEIWFHEEQAADERREEKQLKAACQALGVGTRGFWGGTLYHPDDLPFGINQLPALFTDYKNKLAFNALVREPTPEPDSLKGLDIKSIGSEVLAECLPIAQLFPNPKPVPASQTAFAGKGGETAAWARLRYYFEGSKLVKRYKHTRNEMTGPDYSSKFSPYLAAGCLTAKCVYTELQRFEIQHEKNESTYWLYFELLWRDFFRLVAYQAGPRLFQPSGLYNLMLPWRNDAAAKADFEAWRTGQTGYTLVDAAMRELLQTGYMSNRARQIVASFLTKNLFIDWRWGAEWFESQLIDYDPCSNYGNWCYAAGVGNDGRTFRYFDLPTQAKKYDPDGRFVRTWLPELKALPERHLHSVHLLTEAEQQRYGVALGVDYPKPVVDLKQSVMENETIFYHSMRLSGKRPGNSKRPKPVSK